MTQSTTPTAHIAVGKSRRKEYSDRMYYLDDQQQFELELFNPTNSEILATISINGESISSAGIILNPGQRIFLDRYIDSDARLKFGTYEVDDTPDVQSAISKNGIINVEFFRKQTVNCGGFNTIYTSPYPHYTTYPYYTAYPKFDETPSHLNYTGNVTGALTTNTVMYSSDVSDVSFTNTSFETGRVGEGSKSEQTFDSSSMTFESETFHRVFLKLRPSSTKPITSSEIYTGKYCSNCGMKLKSKWKFCASCGTKL